jgi:hypothetical protein
MSLNYNGGILVCHYRHIDQYIVCRLLRAGEDCVGSCGQDWG